MYESPTNLFDIKTLEYFWLVVKTGKLISAARVLDISQPAISSAIMRIEKKVDMPLMERGGQRQIKLTELGQEIFLMAEAKFSSPQMNNFCPPGHDVISKLEAPNSISIAVSNLVAGRDFAEICRISHDVMSQAQEASINRNQASLTLDIKSVDTADAVNQFNRGLTDIIIIPQLGKGLSLALSKELSNIPISASASGYRLYETTPVEPFAMRLVLPHQNFALYGLDIETMNSEMPLLTYSNAELIAQLFKPGTFTYLTQHQREILETWNINLVPYSLTDALTVSDFPFGIATQDDARHDFIAAELFTKLGVNQVS